VVPLQEARILSGTPLVIRLGDLMAARYHWEWTTGPPVRVQDSKAHPDWRKMVFTWRRPLNYLRVEIASAIAVKTPPLTRASTLQGYANWFASIGAPVETALRRARLPVSFRERPHAWVSYRQVRAFVGDMALREGICDRGMPIVEMSQVFNQGLIAPVLAMPDLHSAIHKLINVCKIQNTGVQFWLEQAGDTARICLQLPLPTTFPGHTISELRTLHLIFQLLRIFAGPVFKPSRVLLTTTRRGLTFDSSDVFRDLPTYTDQGLSALEFPRELLSAKAASTGAPHNASLLQTPATEPFEPHSATDFLTKLLEPYLAEGYPDIQLAVSLMGCSVRTLQRRLDQEGQTYSRVVDGIRQNAAISMLKAGGADLGQMASILGYSEQSAFTRAFRRWTGVTPGRYRDDNAA
jgi:AraC-like DNA-binding protein